MSHYHPKLNIDDLGSFGNRLVPNSYQAEELGEFVEKFCKLFAARFITHRQREAVARYQTNYSSNIYNLDSEHRSEDAVLRAYMDLFDDLFFFGALKGRVSLNFYPHSGDGSLLGQCFTNGSGFAKVELFRPHNPYSGRRGRMIQFLGCLLHEMCHALFLVYACVQGPCFATYDSCGTTGHGAAWQYAAYAVEHTSLPVLGLRFNLNRRNALGHEGGRGRPEHLDHWELHDSSSGYNESSGSGCGQM